MGVVAQFRKRMDSGARCVGPSITFCDPALTEAIAPESDFLWIDTEHSPMSIQTLTGHLLAAKATSLLQSRGKNGIRYSFRLDNILPAGS